MGIEITDIGTQNLHVSEISNDKFDPVIQKCALSNTQHNSGINYDAIRELKKFLLSDVRREIRDDILRELRSDLDMCFKQKGVQYDLTNIERDSKMEIIPTCSSIEDLDQTMNENKTTTAMHENVNFDPINDEVSPLKTKKWKTDEILNQNIKMTPAILTVTAFCVLSFLYLLTKLLSVIMPVGVTILCYMLMVLVVLSFCLIFVDHRVPCFTVLEDLAYFLTTCLWAHILQINLVQV